MPSPPRIRQQILTACRALIVDGTIPRGGILPSEHELAARLGAKRGAVHLALKELEREGLIQSQANGRRIVATGRQMPAALCLANTIGVFTTLPEVGLHGGYPSGWAIQIQFGMIDALCRAGRHVLLVHPASFTQEQRVADFLATPPLGFAALPYQGEPEFGLLLLRQLHERGVRVVTDSDGPEFAAFDRIVHDHASGAAQLTRVLLARGRRRIVRCWEQNGSRADWLKERDIGHERELAAASVPAVPGVDTSGPQIHFFADRLIFESEVRRLMDCLASRLTGPERCDALMLASDGVLPQVAEACRRLGRELGHDLDLVGYDNYWRSLDHQRFATVTPLATIDKDNAGIGAAMAALLEERLAGLLPPAPQRRLTPPKLIEAMSAVPRSKDFA